MLADTGLRSQLGPGAEPPVRNQARMRAGKNSPRDPMGGAVCWKKGIMKPVLDIIMQRHITFLLFSSNI